MPPTQGLATPPPPEELRACTAGVGGAKLEGSPILRGLPLTLPPCPYRGPWTRAVPTSRPWVWEHLGAFRGLRK